MADDDAGAMTGRLISLGSKKGTAAGLSDSESKEMDTLNQKLAMQRRMSSGASLQQQGDENTKKYN